MEGFLSDYSQIVRASSGWTTGSGTTSVGGAIIDMQTSPGYDSCLFLMESLSTGTAATLTIQGANATAVSDFQTIQDPNTSQSAAANSTVVSARKVVAVDVHRNSFRFLRTLVGGCTNVADVQSSVIALKYDANVVPTSHVSSDVSASAKVKHPTT